MKRYTVWIAAFLIIFAGAAFAGDTTTFKTRYGIEIGGTATGDIVTIDGTQTLTNKTLTSPTITGAVLSSNVLTSPEINDTSADHQYIFVPSELAADRDVTLPLLTGDDEFVFKDHTQTLTNKTLTSPTLTSPALGTIASGVGTALTALNGENVQDGTIDDDSIDWADVTGADITLTDCGAITSPTGDITATAGTLFTGVGVDAVGAVDMDYGSVDVTDHTFITDGTGDAEIVLPNDSIGDAEIDWNGLTTSHDFSVTGSLFASVGVDAGSSGAAGSVDVFPSTAASGKLAFVATDSAGDTTTTITNASQAAARTYTIPDAGADAFFVMSTAAQTAAGAISRADLVENTLQPYGIPVNQIMGADGDLLAVSESAGDFFLSLGTNTIELRGEEAISETETSVGYIQFVLPPEYVAAGDVVIRFRCKIDGAGTDNASTFDVEVFEQADGAVGSDICATTVESFAAKSTYYNKDFTVTATGLVAGDILNIKFTAAVIENAGSALAFYSDPPKMLIDIKG